MGSGRSVKKRNKSLSASPIGSDSSNKVILIASACVFWFVLVLVVLGKQWGTYRLK